MKHWLIGLAALATGCEVSMAWAETSIRVPQESYRPDTPRIKAESNVQRRRTAPLPAAGFYLPPLDADELRRLHQDAADGRRQRIGVNRLLLRFTPFVVDAQALEWVQGGGGVQLGELVLGSEGASALRSRLRLESAPMGTRFHFYGSADPDDAGRTLTLGQVSNRRDNTWWSPTTFGDIQILRVELPPAASREDLRFRVMALSHIQREGLNGARDLQDVGTSQFCHQDKNCFTDPLIQQMADAVVKMVYTSGGGTFLCTGNLLGDTDALSFIPYFYSAAHCITSQAAAASLETYWRFQSIACESGLAAAFDTRSGGAQLLYADIPSDVSLLRLNEQPPTGAVFSGWDTAPLQVLDAVISPHHPSGDLKKISFGNVQGFGVPNQSFGDGYSKIGWTDGITESGSSGAGLYTLDNAHFYLRGGLWGGSSNCRNTNGPDFYSRFDRAFPQLSQYLNPSIFTVQNGWWWNPAESGRGFNIEIRNGTLFFGGFLYAADGSATWVNSAGPMSGAHNFRGNLVQYANGQTLTGAYRPPTQTAGLGELSIQFTAPDRGILVWPGGTVPIERFVFGQGARSAGLTPEPGWWWNPAESGRGFAIESQGDLLFVSAYLYETQGDPVWYLASGSLGADNVFRSNWTRYAGGQTLTGSYSLPSIVDANVGSLAIRFLSPASARLTLPDGRVIDLVRFEF